MDQSPERPPSLPGTVRSALHHPRRGQTDGTFIRIVLDAAYPGTVEEARANLAAGRRHERPIVLRPWQRLLLDQAPDAVLRGLIHSDGCRTVNRLKTTLPSGRVAEYACPRYFFTNHSADIRGIFCEYCEMLGIRWTQSNRRNISVAHRASVERLDALVGAKR